MSTSKGSEDQKNAGDASKKSSTSTGSGASSSSQSSSAKGEAPKMTPNPMFKYLGIPDSWATYRPKLPSRNWLIFYTVTFSLTGLYYYDRRKSKTYRDAFAARVQHLHDKPVGWDEAPRRVLVYLSPAPGDTLERKWKYFREHVKPILVAAAVDYDVHEGVEPGDLRNLVKDELQLKKRFENGAVDPSTVDPDPKVQDYMQGLAAKRYGEVPSVIVIGRSTFMEYNAGLHDAEFGHLMPKTEADGDADNTKVPGVAEKIQTEYATAPGKSENGDPPIIDLQSPNQVSEPPVVATVATAVPVIDPTQAEATTGKDEPVVEPPPAQVAAVIPLPLPHTYMPPADADLYNHTSISPETTPTAATSPSDSRSLFSSTPSAPVSTLPATNSNTTGEPIMATLIFVPYDLLMGFRNTPERLYRFFNRRHTVERCGEPVVTLALGGERNEELRHGAGTRPFIARSSMHPNSTSGTYGAGSRIEGSGLHRNALLSDSDTAKDYDDEMWGDEEEFRWIGKIGKDIREAADEHGESNRKVHVHPHIARRLNVYYNPGRE